MSATLSSRIHALTAQARAALGDLQRGIEKEGLRVDPTGFIAQTDHPQALGHPLTHPSITTDYSEALLELITPIAHSPQELLASLEEIHRWVQRHLDNELMWAGSMPCHLKGDESIRIAEYGQSNLGRLKHVYRQGLGVRYGRIMQSIAGLHYNFSLPEAFWSAWQQQLGDSQSLQSFRSDQYFALIRNFRRHCWLLMYLFGASPALDASFLEGKAHPLMALPDGNTWYLPYATSLRMSDLGYHNNAQASLSICFNRLDNFIHTLARAIRKPWPAYRELGTLRDGQYIQLNTNILQIENEYYSPIRPKRTTAPGERPLAALQARGVEYVEVRCLDLNPYLPLGVDLDQVRFLDVFLLYCLLSDSPVISDLECRQLDENFARVVARGREPGLLLHQEGQEVALQAQGIALFDDMMAVAKLLDAEQGGAAYQGSLEVQLCKLQNPALTPSARVLQDLTSGNLSWCDFALNLSRAHQKTLTQEADAPELSQRFRHLAEQSRQDEAAMLASDSCDFSHFLQNYQG